MIDPDIFFIMESKNPNEVVLKKFEQLGYEYYDLVPPTGHGAGGLALFWKQEVHLDVLDANANLMDTVIEGKAFMLPLYMVTVIEIKEICC